MHLCNKTLEKILREANINQRGNIFYKSVEILAYAYDIDIISRFPKSLQEVTIVLDRAARMMRLEISQAKTKYMICSNKKKNVENVYKAKAYPGIFFGGGGSTNSVDDRGQRGRDLGAVAP